MPLAQADTARTSPGVAVTIAVLGNDSGTGLSVTGASQPASGSVSRNPDHSLTYTPQSGFIGTDSFTYTIRDTGGQTATGTVTITVSLPNTAPIARPDAGETKAGTSTTIPVLANDNDPDGEPLSIAEVTNPGHGTVGLETVQGVTTIRYTPQSGFVGTDSFTYTVRDPQRAVAKATVTIRVQAANRPPVANPDTVTTAAGTPVVIDVLANDNDPDGDAVALSRVDIPSHGTLSSAGGRLTYTPLPGFVGQGDFTYTIKDSQGAKATGTVTVDVRPLPNRPPVAQPDSAVSSNGQPVVVPILANDTDLDGDALTLSGLDMPRHGRVDLNLDQRSVTYTPPAGFAGIDEFTYTVSDGKGGTATARVTVTVTAPAAPTFPNGYRYRRRLVVPPQPGATTTLQDFILLVRETQPWLRSVAQGGKVESATGADLRFELEDGTKLDHELESYDPAGGSLIAWVRVPSWTLSSRLGLVLYYGKPGLSTPEADPAGTWRSYLAVWDSRTGTDRSGKGRHLTPANVAGDSLIGGCGRFNGQAVASRADADFLNGLSTLTLQACIQADAAAVGTDRGILAQGPITGSDADLGLGLRYMRRSLDDEQPNCIHFKVWTSQGHTNVQSAANLHGTAVQVLHGTWRAGEVPRLYVDGVATQPVNEPALRGGVTDMATGGLVLGAGSKDNANGGWIGLIDEVRLRASALPAEHVAVEVANIRNPQAFYGLGDEDGAQDANQAAVAVPVTASTRPGQHVDLDVLAAAYDPDRAASLQIAAVSPPAQGVATLFGGKVRYTPLAGFLGRDEFSYTILDGFKSSTARVSVQVLNQPPTNRRLPPPPRSGLAWWSGIFGGKWQNLQSARGRNFDCAIAYIPGLREPGWSQFTTVGRNLRTSDYHTGGLQLFASMRLFPTDECPKQLGKDVWRRAAEGAFDGHWENCARALKTNHPGMLVLRPGWEYNMSGYQWNITMLAAANLPAAQRQIERDWYKTAFRRWVAIFRQLYSQDVLIDWCGIERGAQAGSIDDFYPGNDVVDIIGVDMYDGQPCLSNETIWTRDFNTTFNGGPGGVNAWLAYARSKGKPLSFPEWGVSSLGAGADRVPDNAFYIRKMLEFISANAQHIAYEAYANYEGHTLDADGVVKDGVLVKNPQCRTTYLDFYRNWQQP